MCIIIFFVCVCVCFGMFDVCKDIKYKDIKLKTYHVRFLHVYCSSLRI